MGDNLSVTPVEANYPIVITVCLSLFGITVLTWCLGKIISLKANLAYVLAVRTKSIESWRHLSYTRYRMSLEFHHFVNKNSYPYGLH